MKKFTFIILVLISLATFSQTKMRPIEELINEKDSGWPFAYAKWLCWTLQWKCKKGATKRKCILFTQRSPPKGRRMDAWLQLSPTAWITPVSSTHWFTRNNILKLWSPFRSISSAIRWMRNGCQDRLIPLKIKQRINRSSWSWHPWSSHLLLLLDWKGNFWVA